MLVKQCGERHAQQHFDGERQAQQHFAVMAITDISIQTRISHSLYSFKINFTSKIKFNFFAKILGFCFLTSCLTEHLRSLRMKPLCMALSGIGKNTVQTSKPLTKSQKQLTCKTANYVIAGDQREHATLISGMVSCVYGACALCI